MDEGGIDAGRIDPHRIGESRADSAGRAAGWMTRAPADDRATGRAAFARHRLRPWGWAVGAAVLLAAGGGWLIHRHEMTAALLRADPEVLLATPTLRQAALARGHAVYDRACASCHGGDGAGDRVMGVPDLRDDDRLYGEGLVAQIETIVLHGIRSHDARGWNLASMPAYGHAVPYDREAIAPLSPADIHDVVQYVLAMGGKPADRDAAQRGAAIYAGRGGCYDCHSPDAQGDTAIGAPNLTDDIWLYGHGTAQDIARSITGGRQGVSPAFARTLSPVEARAVAAYVASLAPPSHARADMAQSSTVENR